MKKTLLILIASFTCYNSYSQGTDYDYDGVGPVSEVTSWVDQFDGVTNPGDFSTGTFHLKNAPVITLDANWDMQDQAIVESGIHFIIPNTAIIIGGGVMDVANTGTITVSTNPGIINFASPLSGTLIHNTTSNVKGGIFNNVVIAVNAKLGSNLITTALTVNTGITLDLNTKNLTTGSINCIGSVSGATVTTAPTVTTALSGVTINGSGASNLRFTSGRSALKSLTINCSSPSNITLNTDLTILNNTGSTFTLDNATLDITGVTLNINSRTSTTFGSAGFIKGSATSSLRLGGTTPGSISGSLNMDQTSSATKTLNNFFLNRSGQSISLGNALEIVDSVKVTAGALSCAGNLTLKSTDALKGRIAEIGAAGSVTGNITVETFARGGATGWANLGPSGVSGLTISSWDGQIPMSCVGCINDENSAGGYFVSVQGDPLGDGTFTELTGSTALNPGTGYWIYLGDDVTTTSSIMWSVSGPVVTGNIVSGTGLVSNPYPSPISLQRLQADNAGMGAIDVFNADNGTFTTFNGGIPSNGVIPMGQGFYISAGATVDFKESHKVARNTAANPLLKTSTSIPVSPEVGVVFQLNIAGSNGESDNTYLRFHTDATPGFDLQLDGYKKFATPGYLGYPGPYSKYTTISTKVGSDDYSINSLPFATNNNAVIPVLVKVSTTGTYSISPVDIANLPPSACVTLKDKLLNVNHDLRSGAYVCNINDSTSAARFELTICASSIIPTGVGTVAAKNSSIFINQDQAGAYVKTRFEATTKATISVYNTMGQQLVADKEVEGKENTTYLDLGNVHSQVVIIKVTTATESSFKKIFVN